MIFTGNKPSRLGFTPPDRTELQDLMQRAAAKFDAMPPEEKRKMMEEQRRSWARGEAGMGSDADEAAYATALRAGDTDEVARLEAESQERVALVDKMFEEGKIR